MTREILSSSLAALAAELDDVRKSDVRLRFAAANLIGAAREIDEDKDAPESLKEIAGQMRASRDAAVRKRKSLAGIRTRLETIGAALSEDRAAWEAERGTYETVVRVLGSMERTVAVPAVPVAEPEPEAEMDERAFKPTTLLSVAGRSVLDDRRKALNPGNKKDARYQERLETAFAAFLDVIGDKPLSYYLPIHMQDFATVLGSVPANRSKFRIFDGLTLRQIGEKNAKLPQDQRKKCLSKTTVDSYLSEVKNIWTRVSAGVAGLRDMGALKVTMPKDAENAIKRVPLAVSSVNIWLRDAAQPKRMKTKPYQAWLPLAGLLTGMRLAELIYLQKTDFVDIEGHEVIDLTRPLWIDGEEIDRPVKTKTSKRYVAIHPLLRDCGFVEYAKNIQRADGFVFGYFLKNDDPPDSAQKQMSNWMHGIGIHQKQRQVFHSLRHNAKHWLRVHLDRRIADLQLGHAMESVSDKYGYETLEPEEIAKVMAIPAPKGVDFSPMLVRV